MSDTASAKKIIFIDDDALLLDLYATKFTKSGFDVQPFLSAQEALDKIKGGLAADVVIFDIDMPGMDGWTFAREYRTLGLLPAAKLVVLSNQSQQEDIDKAKEFKTDLFIVKALKTPAEVVLEINRIM